MRPASADNTPAVTYTEPPAPLPATVPPQPQQPQLPPAVPSALSTPPASREKAPATDKRSAPPPTPPPLGHGPLLTAPPEPHVEGKLLLP
jgi:hypothetical protein